MIIKIHIFCFSDFGIVTYQYRTNEIQNKQIVSLLEKDSVSNFLLEVDTDSVKTNYTSEIENDITTS